jgi:hypothetical protein
MTDNWTENSDKTIYRHKTNPKVTVAILPNVLEPKFGKYYVVHSHPAPNGGFVMQPMEGARDMASARKKAEMHMRHWNDPTKWREDPDYGKMGLRGK